MEQPFDGFYLTNASVAINPGISFFNLGINLSKYDGATIEVINWETYNPRKDVKAPRWFRLDHGFFENPDFYDFAQGELLVWLYLLCTASRKSSARFVLNLAHAERVGRLKPRDLETAIEKLVLIQVVRVDVTPTLRARDVGDTASHATLHNRTSRDVTNTDRKSVV